MKKLVFQAWTGPEPPDYAKRSEQSAKAYADAIGADFKFYRGPFRRHYGTPETNPFFSTFAPFYNGDWSRYNALLYLDSDTLVRKGAPSIFDCAPAGARIGAVNLLSGPCRTGKWGEVQGHSGVGGHFNAGVLLWGSAPLARGFNASLIRDWPRELSGRMGGHTDQGWLNEMGWLEPIPCAWNYHLAQFVPEGRSGAFVVHYHSQAREMFWPDANSGEFY